LLKVRDYGLLQATPSFKPLPVYPLGLARLVLRRLSIWLLLVAVVAQAGKVVVAVLVVIGLELA
jgi:hypothetical protein